MRIAINILLITACIFLVGCPNEKNNNKYSSAVKFIKPLNNLKIKRGEELNLQIKIEDINELMSLKIFSKDTVFYNDQVTSDIFNLTIPTTVLKIGTNQISLEANLKSGKTINENRLIKILSDVYPVDYSVKVINEFPHLTTSYTQGLEFSNGELFESTGGTGSTGKSLLAKVNIQSGQHTQSHFLENSYFGEGITILNDKIFQLTWQQHKAFVYSKNSFELLTEYSYSGEGWGICNNGELLIMSDGSERLYFRDPNTFGTLKTIEVYSNQGPVKNLNELEYVDGKIYANIYQSNNIVVIDPKTGIVEQIIDCSELALNYKKSGEVLNGIAFNSSTNTFFLTGKNWASLLEVEIIEL